MGHNLRISGLISKALSSKNNRKDPEFIIIDNHPLSVVENTGFRHLMEHLDTRYSLPSRTYISKTAFPPVFRSKMAAQSVAAAAPGPKNCVLMSVRLVSSSSEPERKKTALQHFY